jgi:hypothetical protein
MIPVSNTHGYINIVNGIVLATDISVLPSQKGYVRTCIITYQAHEQVSSFVIVMQLLKNICSQSGIWTTFTALNFCCTEKILS